MYEKIKFVPSGDSGLILEVGNEISKDINKKIRALGYCIEEKKLDEIIEIIPTYTTILIIYDSIKSSYKELVEKLNDIEKSINNIKLPPAEVIHIPTLYGGDYGMDLENVAKHNGLTRDEVIDIHSSPNYLVYMLGFTPGFTYLGGMSEKISTPRLEIPREKIPAGSVGIAGSQTGIYPIDSPGGWQIIGRTPLKLFDPERNPSVLLKAGQYLKFEPVNEEEYHTICKKIIEDKYDIKKTILKGEE
ncbi:5-oxoprolinase subunit PxpB [Paramaledivibacter caminithermalis]|jgi:KipI family sensor histidine kinase inhibitor|uniref:Sensor histidine kinase inhibitor, KipI family n=1 Tax=Paramaledivibacter caminithermalis (strain DSM 15212 / CIP 107654 / DViRD3) TaxID=1121301 RepID=A0A1M6LJR2_PARC5|nr:5-oxoprolinase subunit PxpB [Paramaledivibacter caminithermalis]SHJ71395.1 sensor histidine kinase inhibitor, KipI family [Paramaledivibacter caminithermalis DSM 15212]